MPPWGTCMHSFWPKTSDIVDSMSRNLLNSLFSYRPREGINPRENYLTEAFAYVLESSPDVCRAFVAAVIPTDIDAASFTDFTIEPQSSFLAEEGDPGASRPDMLVTCNRAGKDPYVVYSEHKWGSNADAEQLRRYKKVAGQNSSGSTVVSIGATIMQVAVAAAEPDCDHAMLWETVYELLNKFKTTSAPVADFLGFLDEQGLSPHVPLSLGKIAAYSSSVSVPNDCLRVVEHLRKQDWACIPSFYSTHVMPKPLRWGRVGLEFYRTEFAPQIFVGFLLDPYDHGLKFVDKDRGIDLALFIECRPPSTKPKGSAWIDRTREIRSRFPKVEARDFTEIQKKYRKLTVQQCLADVIKGHHDEETQTEAVHRRLQSWAEVLFKDGTLESAMRDTWSDPSGGSEAPG